MSDDYDSPWKEVLERYFPDFLAFFFPAAHADIVWKHGYCFLDKELQKVVRDAEIGRRWADKLVQVTTRDGSEDWLLQLPAALDDQLWTELQDHEEATTMRYVTSVERIGLRKGMEKGMEKGLQQGLNSERRALLRLIRRRFGETAADHSALTLERIDQPPVLEDLFENLLDCADETAWLTRLSAAAETKGESQ